MRIVPARRQYPAPWRVVRFPHAVVTSTERTVFVLLNLSDLVAKSINELSFARLRIPETRLSRFLHSLNEFGFLASMRCPTKEAASEIPKLLNASLLNRRLAVEQRLPMLELTR